VKLRRSEAPLLVKRPRRGPVGAGLAVLDNARGIIEMPNRPPRQPDGSDHGHPWGSTTGKGGGRLSQPGRRFLHAGENHLAGRHTRDVLTPLLKVAARQGAQLRPMVTACRLETPPHSSVAGAATEPDGAFCDDWASSFFGIYAVTSRCRAATEQRVDDTARVPAGQMNFSPGAKNRRPWLARPSAPLPVVDPPRCTMLTASG